MRNSILLILVILFLTSFNTEAQEQGNLRLGLGMSFGSDLAIFGSDALLITSPTTGFKTGKGLSVWGEYFITDIISLVPSYTLFFETIAYAFVNGNSRRAFRARIFNIDGRYYFYNEGVQLYGIGGIALFKSKYSESGTGVGFINESAQGLNLGAGGVFELDDKININAQFKYMTAAGGHTVFRFGVGIKI